MTPEKNDMLTSAMSNYTELMHAFVHYSSKARETMPEDVRSNFKTLQENILTQLVDFSKNELSRAVMKELYKPEGNTDNEFSS